MPSYSPNRAVSIALSYDSANTTFKSAVYSIVLQMLLDLALWILRYNAIYWLILPKRVLIHQSVVQFDRV